ncbi:MAG: hypothetical protein L6R41_000417 [Letrouitia leprolyta]|nr:MAG: hypothetical protein L6R41_000417 [Letrouitia leprolyta]
MSRSWRCPGHWNVRRFGAKRAKTGPLILADDPRPDQAPFFGQSNIKSIALNLSILLSILTQHDENTSITSPASSTMHDPFPIPPPPLLVQTITPFANYFSLSTLPIHIHELLFATLTYHLICAYISPILSRRLFPSIYPSLPTRTRLNWDVHVVSLAQSILVCAAALWIMYADEERRGMDWKERVWGYTGGGGMIQAFAAGYFLWDLQICLRYMRIFGVGLLMHAVAALVVFSLGFEQRPFVNFYGPTFILYELSSPFLNFHWFFDKLQMTGSRAQWYNGIFLILSFFCCRLLWGTYQSIRVYQDCWAALHVENAASNTSSSGGLPTLNITNPRPIGIPELLEEKNTLGGAKVDLMRFNPSPTNIPTWLAITYLGSNVLNSLNFYWFLKMIETVKKRFQTSREDRKEFDGGKVVDAVVEGVELDGRIIEEVKEEMDRDVREGKGKGKGKGTGLEDADGEVRRRG